MFLVVVQEQHQYVTGHAGVWAVSSETSDRLQKRHNRYIYMVKSHARWPSFLDFPVQSFISGTCPGFDIFWPFTENTHDPL